MIIKKVLPILSVLALSGIFLFLLAGCNQPVTSSDKATSAVSNKPALPLLDTLPHGSLETAYFALG